MTPLLEVTGLTKKLGSFSLNNISFSLEPGYILGIIGVNGSGKTTLLRTILNLYQPEEGLVKVNGFSMADQEKEAKEQIGTVLDEDFFDETLTPEANAAVYGPYYPDFDMNIFREACRRFEIPLKQKVKTLSRGIRTKMQFAFALAHKSQLYLMDEPAGGLDPCFRKSLIGCMQEIVESGERSIVFSTHLTQDLDQIADYILMIHNGKAVFCVDKEKLRGSFCLVRGTKEEIDALPPAWIVGKEHGLYHSEALLHLLEENRSLWKNMPAPELSSILYYLERGTENVENDVSEIK